MEKTFIAALNVLRPAPAYLRLFKAIVLGVWNAKRKDAVSTEAALRRRGEDINARRDRLTEAYTYRSAIDTETYQRELDKLKTGAAQVEGDRQDADLERLDVEGLVNYATHMLVNAGTMWRDAEHEQRLRR